MEGTLVQYPPRRSVDEPPSAANNRTPITMSAPDNSNDDIAALRAVEDVMSRVRPPSDRRRHFHDEFLRVHHVDDAVIDTHWQTIDPGPEKS